ncbi:hypothetical protein BDN72DRAFT_949291 [Pluteus cervinus]|uniref:Uncharacterized protein n=1 Tax=Pluteus cervinus TaxID=181527 RepID=A0ACD3B8N7_9AGAR|nr:hypothetical protein BDN72DRAFT_949291 [Pluteus cervinus]
MTLKFAKRNDERRATLKAIADETLAAIDQGYYTSNGTKYRIHDKTEDSKRRTRYYAPESLLSAWSTKPDTSSTSASSSSKTEYSILEISTLDGARYLSTPSTSPIPAPNKKIGILNFASAKKPGGGFLNGAQAQEESIARSSNLYPTLMTETAQKFYSLHAKDHKEGYYTHAMVYSPRVQVFRNDEGDWLESVQVDVLTSPAVNAGVVRKSLQGRLQAKLTEERIRRVMRARMGRILYLFEKEGVRDIVLGSFGTGVFQNDINVVATLWAELLAIKGARFEKSFDRVVFAILGRETILKFEGAWEEMLEKDVGGDGDRSLAMDVS